MSVSVQQILGFLRAVAPQELALDWDNVGLLVDAGQPVDGVLTTLDITPAVVRIRRQVSRSGQDRSLQTSCRGRACPARNLPANVLRLTAAGRIYAAPAALQNKSLLHHNRCRRLLYLFKWLHGLVGCLRRGRSDCFWHGQGGSVMCH